MREETSRSDGNTTSDVTTLRGAIELDRLRTCPNTAEQKIAARAASRAVTVIWYVVFGLPGTAHAQV